MGSVFTLHIQLPEFTTPDSNSFSVPSWTFFALSLFGLIGLYIITKVCFPFLRPYFRTRSLAPSSVLLVLFLVLTILVPQIDSRPKAPIIKKLGKPVVKSAIPLLASSAVYFGLDSLAQALSDDPNPQSVLIGLLSTLAAAVILILVALLWFIFRYIFYRTAPTVPVPPTNIELDEIRSGVTELIQRSDPPRSH